MTPEAAESGSENSQPALQPRQTPQPGSPQQGTVRAASARRARRRRDRRGRGLRGRLAPPEVPISRTRAEQFDDLVLDAVEHLEQRWSEELDGVEFAVEEVPDDSEQLDGGRRVPVGRGAAGPADPRDPAAGATRRRRGSWSTAGRIEARAPDREDAAELVLDVLVHEVARLLGVEPEVIDPEGHGGVD